MQGVNHMRSWYEEMAAGSGVTVFTSESGYINSALRLKYLDHLIHHLQCGYLQAGQTPPIRALLMDQHGSHMTPEFVLKAIEYNIHPFPFPGHLTHILQPLDVAVFQPFKHWHRKAVQHATRNIESEYTITSFF
jgi:hypothetical protein